MHYSIEPRERRYVKGYGFLSFARNLNNKYGQMLVDSAKKSAIDAFKVASKRAIQETSEATGALVENTIANKIISFSKKPTSELHPNLVNNETPKKDIYLHKKDRKLLMN